MAGTFQNFEADPHLTIKYPFFRRKPGFDREEARRRLSEFERAVFRGLELTLRWRIPFEILARQWNARAKP